jgi:dTDP-glucose 4,6-dehydratase
MRKLTNILVTGGAGFIGTNFIRYLFGASNFNGHIINLDALTYAGNAANLADVATRFGERYVFVHGDIRDRKCVDEVFARYGVDTVVHFAAESHVDRSITGPAAFLDTNVMGTLTLLEAAKTAWRKSGGDFRHGVLFHHISTDEVYGSLGDTGYFSESTAYDPRSPYSASKAASDHLVMAYHHTYGLPVTLTNCSNNYGPYQFPEKLIPLMITNMLKGLPLPVYGDGKNIRDWVYVEDHNAAVWTVMQQGKWGAKYNIGGENEWENIKLLRTLIGIVCDKTGMERRAVEATITPVPDRLGHDRRYAIDCTKIKGDLDWAQKHTFEEGLSRTVDWYVKKGL